MAKFIKDVLYSSFKNKMLSIYSITYQHFSKHQTLPEGVFAAASPGSQFLQ